MVSAASTIQDYEGGRRVFDVISQEEAVEADCNRCKGIGSFYDIAKWSVLVEVIVATSVRCPTVASSCGRIGHPECTSVHVCTRRCEMRDAVTICVRHVEACLLAALDGHAILAVVVSNRIASLSRVAKARKLGERGRRRGRW